MAGKTILLIGYSCCVWTVIHTVNMLRTFQSHIRAYTTHTLHTLCAQTLHTHTTHCIQTTGTPHAHDM